MEEVSTRTNLFADAATCRGRLAKCFSALRRGGVAGCSILLALKPKFTRAAAGEIRTPPLGFCAIVISSALLVYNLAPFDFIGNSQELHDSFRRLQFLSFPLGLSEITNELCGAAWFAVLGFLITRDALRQSGRPFTALGAGLIHGLLLACLIECLQLFTRSHVPEGSTAIIRVLGALLGAWAAACLLHVTVNCSASPPFARGD